MNCENCENWNRGIGNSACLKCNKYHEIITGSGKRHTIKIIPVPDNILESIPDETINKDTLHAIRSLPNDLAAIISLIYFAGMTHKQVAEILHVSRQAITRKHTLAIILLKKIIQ